MLSLTKPTLFILCSSLAFGTIHLSMGAHCRGSFINFLLLDEFSVKCHLWGLMPKCANLYSLLFLIKNDTKICFKYQ